MEQRSCSDVHFMTTVRQQGMLQKLHKTFEISFLWDVCSMQLWCFLLICLLWIILISPCVTSCSETNSEVVNVVKPEHGFIIDCVFHQRAAWLWSQTAREGKKKNQSLFAVKGFIFDKALFQSRQERKKMKIFFFHNVFLWSYNHPWFASEEYERGRVP